MNSSYREISPTDSRAIASSWLQICFSERLEARLSRSSIATGRRSTTMSSAAMLGPGSALASKSTANHAASQLMSRSMLSPLPETRGWQQPFPQYGTATRAEGPVASQGIARMSRHSSSLQRAKMAVSEISRPTSSIPRSPSPVMATKEEIVTLAKVKGE